MFWTTARQYMSSSLKAVKHDRQFKVASVLDADAAFLSKLHSVYDPYPGIQIHTFLYPGESDSFYKQALKSDFCIVAYNLGGGNGANVVKSLMRRGASCKILLVTDDERELDRYNYFKYFVSRDRIANDPAFVLDLNGTPVDQAVEATVLLLQDKRREYSYAASAV